MRQLGLMRSGELLVFAALVAACGPTQATAPSPATTSSAQAQTQAGRPEPEAPPLYTIETTEIEAQAKHSFVLRLPENPGTPMRMQVSVEGGECLRLLGERHEDRPIEGCEACAGYPGLYELTYVAETACDARLVVREVHVAGRLEPEQKARIAVHVR